MAIELFEEKLMDNLELLKAIGPPSIPVEEHKIPVDRQLEVPLRRQANNLELHWLNLILNYS